MTCSGEVDKLIFIGDWFQQDAAINRTFSINYYPSDNGIELFDINNRKVFLKRTCVTHLRISDFFIGAKVNILGRLLEITDFGDSQTRDVINQFRKKTLVIIKPDGIPNMGRIIQCLNSYNMIINNAKMVQFTIHNALEFFGEENKSNLKLTLSFEDLTKGKSVIFELLADNALEKLRSLAGPSDPDDAKKQCPSSIHAQFGTTWTKNAIYCPETEAEAQREIEYIFCSNRFKDTPTFKNSTICVIKPHAMKEGSCGRIITDIIDNGFLIIALKTITLEKPHSEEFYEVYNGVAKEYLGMVTELCSGLCMVLELTNDDCKDTHCAFRKLCGPIDPEIGRKIRPCSLRAKYGRDKVQNAVHCTDLPEDVLLELEYFFKVLA